MNSLTDEYLRLISSVGWSHRTAVDMRKALSRSLWVGTVDKDGETIGAARLVGDGVYNAVLYDLVVRPDYQGQGIGRRLTDEALKFAVHNCIKRVECISTEGAENFYRKIGWDESRAFYVEG